MKKYFPSVVVVFLLLAAVSGAQIRPVVYAAGANVISAMAVPSATTGAVALPLPAATAAPLPRMAPDLALRTYLHHAAEQSADLAGYSAKSVIIAELPDTAKEGQYEVERYYSAPRSLEFKALRFMGDSFVKSNVITRLLQSEVDHVQKDDPAQTAITPANYKFSYRGETDINGRLVHVYQVKPHKKRAGLFKGRIYLDARTGTLARAEGTSKSPSIFVKKIEFVQDYADFASFTLPVHMHSEARARIVGRAIVDVQHTEYRPITASLQPFTPISSF